MGAIFVYILASFGLVTVLYLFGGLTVRVYRGWKADLVSLIRYNTMVQLVTDNENLKRENNRLDSQVDSMEHKIKCLERMYP